MVSVLLDYLRVSDSSLPVTPTPFISSGFFLSEWVPPLSSWYLAHSCLCHYAFLLSEDTSTGMGFPGGADGKESMTASIKKKVHLWRKSRIHSNTTHLHSGIFL